MAHFRIALTALVIITALLGDSIVELTQHPLLKAVMDNAVHAVIGLLTGMAFMQHYIGTITDSFGSLLVFLCFIGSSIIDVDHFIEARSFNLEDAINLTKRPFLHCSSIIGVLCIFYISTACLNYFRTSLILGILICAFLTHHTRDAIRRGFWICPFGHTQPISQLAYILITILTPYMMAYLHSICRSTFVQQWLAKFVQLNEHGQYRPEYRYLHV